MMSLVLSVAISLRRAKAFMAKLSDLNQFTITKLFEIVVHYSSSESRLASERRISTIWEKAAR